MTLATKAGECNLSWPWASWGQITSGGGGYVVFKNLVTGQQEQLQEQPATIALDGASVAFDDLTSAYLIDNIAGGTQDVRSVDTEFTTASGDAQHLQFVTVNDRLVAWNLDTGPVAVWDRIQHRLVQLPPDNGTSAAWVAGPLLIWLVPEPAAQQKQDDKAQLIGVPTLDVLDTTTLPTAPPAP